MECIILYDLLLQSNNTTFQVDSLLIYKNNVLLFEVKSFEGDFFVQGDHWHVAHTKKEISSPILQLQRSEYLLRNLLSQMGSKFSITSYVVFVNNEFTLYNAPFNIPIIFPGQIRRFISRLNNDTAIITDHHKRLGSQLINRHITENPFEKLPDYDFEQLAKGITCSSCFRLMSNYKSTIVFCDHCNIIEKNTTAVLRSINEFMLLFPDQKVTVTVVYEWCV